MPTSICGWAFFNSKPKTMATKKNTATKKQSSKETTEANDARKPAQAAKNTASKKLKNGDTIKITAGVAWLGYGFNVGQDIKIGGNLDANQGQELIDKGYAKKV